MSLGEVRYALNSTIGTDNFVSLDQIMSYAYGRHQLFDKSGTFVVPQGVTEIYISGCGAGGSGQKGAKNDTGGLGGKAGEFVIRERVVVNPGETFTINVGTGNTTITSTGGYSKTLVANAINGSTPTTILGYYAGFDGVNGYYEAIDSAGEHDSDGEKELTKMMGKCGSGGAFGFGGGGGTITHKLDVNYGGYYHFMYPPLGGAVINYNQRTLVNFSPNRQPSLLNGGDAAMSTDDFYGITSGAKAGGYGAGGGGAAREGSDNSMTGGAGSPGMVFIEWGALQ